MEHYDAYLFDWDGTLAQSHEFWIDLMRSQITRYGFEMDDRTIVSKLFGRYVEGIQEMGVPAQDIKRLSDETVAIGAERMPFIDLYPGAADVLRELDERGKKIGIITATYRDVVGMAIEHHGLLEILDIVITGDEVAAQKPDPGGIQKALQVLDVKPGKAIMVGDSPKDIMAGNNAGTDTLLFHPPGHAAHHNAQELQRCKPTYTISSWQEMLKQIQ